MYRLKNRWNKAILHLNYPQFNVAWKFLFLVEKDKEYSIFQFNLDICDLNQKEPTINEFHRKWHTFFNVPIHLVPPPEQEKHLKITWPLLLTMRSSLCFNGPNQNHQRSNKHGRIKIFTEDFKRIAKIFEECLKINSIPKMVESKPFEILAKSFIDTANQKCSETKTIAIGMDEEVSNDLNFKANSKTVISGKFYKYFTSSLFEAS